MRELADYEVIRVVSKLFSCHGTRKAIFEEAQVPELLYFYFEKWIIKTVPVAVLKQAPQGVLKRGLHNNSRTAHFIAEHASYTPELIEQLAKMNMNSVKRGLLLRADISLQLFERLANNALYEGNENVMDSVVSNERCPAGILQAYSKTRNTGLRRKIARHPNTPSVVLERYGKGKNPELLQAVLANQNCPIALVEKLADHENRKIRNAAIRSQRLSDAMLDGMMHDSEPSVRVAVAECYLFHQTPTNKARAIQLQLDPHKEVRVAATEALWETVDEKVRGYMAKGARIPVEAILKSAESITPDLFDYIMQSHDEEAQLALAHRSDLKLEQFERLLQAPSVQVQDAVVQNQAYPISLLDPAMMSDVRLRQSLFQRNDFKAGLLPELLRESDFDLLAQVIDDNFDASYEQSLLLSFFIKVATHSATTKDILVRFLEVASKQSTVHIGDSKALRVAVLSNPNF